jgi:alcohol dehydrogenase class IV
VSLTGNWNYPTAVRFGAGRLSELGAACLELGIRNPLIVTDPRLAGLPMIKAAETSVKDAGLSVACFADVRGNPSGENVEAGLAAYRAGDHDGVIAFGGGSALDAGKAIALMVGQNCGLWELEDSGDNWLNADPDGIAPIIGVPTTSGTGSEVGRASIITDSRRQVKKIIFHPKMLPSIVIADPALTLGLPASLTAATGMDALSHNLEAFCAPHYHPMARGIAIEGIRLIKDYLPTVVDDGADLTGRSQMMVASSMGATAFQRGLGAMHALAHPLGALYDAHHGLLNAVLMPYVLQANRSVIEKDITWLANALELDDGFDGFLRWVLALREDVGIAGNLAAIDIDTERAGLVGRMATEDPSAGGNPISFTASEYSEIFERAVRGDLQEG